MLEKLAKYQITIGIECHVQLATKTKLFSGADNDARNKSPNSVVSPIDFALPGMLPVLNFQAVKLAVIAAKALNAPVARISRFDRKHYFYPDLPSGYQVSQFYQPTIGAGYVNVPQPDGSEKKVRINHAHIEADAGKMTHHGGHSEIDFNRVGTPLIEIVSEPDIHSPQEAKLYATELYLIMVYAGVTLGDLYHGNMRFDVNISLNPKGSNKLGTRTEIKNLNSFKSVERAAEYEANRQAQLLDEGQNIVQETRGWDEAQQKTTSLRSKENAQDYRYMPDPDIPPLELSDNDVEKMLIGMPKLPPYYRQRLIEIGFDETVVSALLASKDSADCVDRIYQKSGILSAKKVGIWLLMIIQDDSRDELRHIDAPNSLSDDFLIELANMVEQKLLSATAAKDVFMKMLKSGLSPHQIASDNNLIQKNDSNELSEIIDSILKHPDNQKAIADIKQGNQKAIGFLVGQVMKQSKGSANPSVTRELIVAKLN